MSSQALYRKWRSQTFDDLVGQAHIVQALRNAIAANRIGHAYLFTGPRGVGKTSAARILSKAVNCEQSDPRLRPCGECSACRAIVEGRAVDVIEMDAASHTSVDDAREIIEKVQFRPTQFRKKVYVIDEVHMLSTAAFNALLKTLEEPPDHAMFILATTEFHKVPATILSRCQRFVFNRHTIANTIAHLEWVAGEEGIFLEPGVAEAIARAATGSMRDAMSILDQLMGYGEPQIPLSRVQSLLGATASREVETLVAAFAAEDVAAALSVINTIADQGADLRQFTRDVVSYLRGLMLLKSGGSADLLDVGHDVLATMQSHSQQLALASILAWLKIFSGLDHQLRTTPYGQLPLEMAVVEALVVPAPVAVAAASPIRGGVVPVARPTPAPAAPRQTEPAAPQRPTPVAPVAAKVEPAIVEQPPQVVEAAPVAAVVVAQPLPEAEQHIVLAESEILLAEVEAVWLQVIEDLKPYNPRLQAVLKSCEPLGLEDNTLLIGTPSPFHTKQLDDQTQRRLIEDLLAKAVGRQIFVRGEEANRDQQNRARDARRQREEIMKDQIVKAARNIFDARIVGVQEDGS
ncbi:DNA polymerase III subunit gamma/tau [Herpetosiphon geysericola]|uniref:DNA polymerase III subunit gamma/tau n=1 Tax=Herpetosiphon geysericola TaxID=70996 RepID=A0A0P6XMW7_9CHLR|nr:DNA polymerase III subunit gamma/tau [Herpetosiphon geysericola]KPL81201.1 DNA polymerase III subunits gamma and tau [Herpetosiphon geysericola]